MDHIITGYRHRRAMDLQMTACDEEMLVLSRNMPINKTLIEASIYGRQH